MRKNHSKQVDKENVGKYVLFLTEVLDMEEEFHLLFDLPDCRISESLDVSVEDGVLALAGTIDLGERAAPRFRTCSLGGFARLFHLSPDIPWDRVSTAVEDRYFCIRIPKGPV
jgi:HSP20 family molecular chaperone IbpA